MAKFVCEKKRNQITRECRTDCPFIKVCFLKQLDHQLILPLLLIESILLIVVFVLL